MSTQTQNNNRNSSTDKEETDQEKISITRIQNNKNGIEYENKSTNLNEITQQKELSKVYPYPILYHNERDPLEEFKLRIIKSKNKGADTFLNNYLKFNFAKNDVSNINQNDVNNKILLSQMSNGSYSKISKENSKNNLFITENKKREIKIKDRSPKTINFLSDSSNSKKNKGLSVMTHKRIIKKSKSEVFNPYSRAALFQYRTSYLQEMEKRGNMYNKIKLAQLQRIALQNFSLMDSSGNRQVTASIPTGKFDESYILETKKRKRLPGIKEYICSRLKSMKAEEVNTPEYYRERSKKYEKNKLPEIINIKNSGRFQFHVFHDQYGFKKELDKKEISELKMTKDKIRDLKIMAKINKINDPEIIDIYKRAVYKS
jgi:hypothetical protein